MPNPALEMPDTLKLFVDRSPELLRNATLPGSHLPAMKVTKTHLFTVSPFEGTPGEPDDCPIAVAIGRLFAVKEMHIEGERPWFTTEDGKRHNLFLSADVALWVGRFDRHEPVLPFEMYLELSD
jgi:hypothetical protein